MYTATCLFFCFDDVRAIQHYNRAMLLFPSLDTVRTVVYAIHYATIYVRDTVLCTDNAASFCTGNLLARNKRRDLAHYDTVSHSFLITHVVVLSVYGLLGCVPLL